MTNENKFIKARQMLCLFLKSEAEAKGITQQDIADKTGFLRQNVGRILNAQYSPTLDNFLKVADAIGVNFFMESKDSPSDTNTQFEKAMTDLGRRKGFDKDKLN